MAQMAITSKGQVTIPKAIREVLSLFMLGIRWNSYSLKIMMRLCAPSPNEWMMFLADCIKRGKRPPLLRGGKLFPSKKWMPLSRNGRKRLLDERGWYKYIAALSHERRCVIIKTGLQPLPAHGEIRRLCYLCQRLLCWKWFGFWNQPMA